MGFHLEVGLLNGNGAFQESLYGAEIDRNRHTGYGAIKIVPIRAFWGYDEIEAWEVDMQGGEDRTGPNMQDERHMAFGVLPIITQAREKVGGVDVDSNEELSGCIFWHLYLLRSYNKPWEALASIFKGQGQVGGIREEMGHVSSQKLVGERVCRIVSARLKMIVFKRTGTGSPILQGAQLSLIPCPDGVSEEALAAFHRTYS
jgi:hypothetical protein